MNKQLSFQSIITPRVITILATYKCTAACQDCCFNSNPYITKRISLKEIIDFIEDAAKVPTLELVVFSGGECFLLGDDLVSAVRYANLKGLKVRCVTNGYWAQSITVGRKVLQRLKEAGLNELNISTGDYHQEWVSENTMVNAVELAVEIMGSVLLMVELQKNRLVTARKIRKIPRIKNLPPKTLNILESPWMPMTDDKEIEQHKEVLINKTNLHQRHGCNTIYNTLVITPDKKLGVCCGLTREQIPELNLEWNTETKTITKTIHEINKDFMKIWLYVDGPEKILAWAASKNPEIEWENKYAHHCHTCKALFGSEIVRNTIRAHYKEIQNEVLVKYKLKAESTNIRHEIMQSIQTQQ